MARAPVPSFWLVDMDGVLVREGTVVPGAVRVPRRAALLGPALPRAHQQLDLHAAGPARPGSRDGARRRRRGELWTAGARHGGVRAAQRPNGTAFVLGEAGLTTALHEVGYVLTDRDPDYVIFGETRTYSFEAITKAVRLIAAGARFLAANPDATGPSPEGILPATGRWPADPATPRARPRTSWASRTPSWSARASTDRGPLRGDGDGRRPDGHRRVAGIEAGLETILVLSGVTRARGLERFPYRPARVVASVAELIDEVAVAVPA